MIDLDQKSNELIPIGHFWSNSFFAWFETLSKRWLDWKKSQYGTIRMQWVWTRVQHLQKQNGKRKKALQWDPIEGIRNVSFFLVQQIPGHLYVFLTTYKCKTYHVVLLDIAHTLYFTFFTSDKMSNRQFDDHWTSNRILAFTWHSWSGSRMIKYAAYFMPYI